MSGTQIETRLKNLEAHLQEENDVLYHVVQSFRDLDKIAYKLGILDQEYSYAISVSWWPMISILGTFSAGKSTFINSQLGKELQRTGNQAVDDKFTVLCYGDIVNTLPGIALDADPRFPFYQISQDIAEITAGTGQRVDAFLQVKTCPSEALRGKILIDSPGFDADSQRTSTLRITNHIIDQSDLVLIFFDARHPEPGAMRDTLEHLVSNTISRHDSNKFLYILNQIDITAREDNPEEVVAAWLRSLAQAGLTAGRFYRIYNPHVCMPFPNDNVRRRFEQKCQADMAEIQERMEQVGRDRAYRVVSMLEQTAKDIENKIVPQLQYLIQRWKMRVFRVEMIMLIFLAIILGIGYAMTSITPQDIDWQNPITLGVTGVIILIALIIHVKISKSAANHVAQQLKYQIVDEETYQGLTRAFRKNTCFWRSLFIWFINQPVGWSNSTRKKIYQILNKIDGYVQDLNNRFTNPSGKKPKIEEPIES
jgi:GTPase SAR1 family protein